MPTLYGEAQLRVSDLRKRMGALPDDTQGGDVRWDSLGSSAASVGWADTHPSHSAGATADAGTQSGFARGFTLAAADTQSASGASAQSAGAADPHGIGAGDPLGIGASSPHATPLRLPSASLLTAHQIEEPLRLSGPQPPTPQPSSGRETTHASEAPSPAVFTPAADPPAVLSPRGLGAGARRVVASFVTRRDSDKCLNGPDTGGGIATTPDTGGGMAATPDTGGGSEAATAQRRLRAAQLILRTLRLWKLALQVIISS